MSRRPRKIVSLQGAFGAIALAATFFCSAFGAARAQIPGESVVPRRIVAAFDGTEEADPRRTRIHRFAELPLNHLGYVVSYIDLSRQNPPQTLDADVAAIMAWFDGPSPAGGRFAAWAASAARAGADPDGLKLVVLGHPGVAAAAADDAAAAYLARLGLRVAGGEQRLGLWSRVVASDAAMIGFERDFTVVRDRVPQVVAEAPRAESRLRLAPYAGVDLALDLVVTSDGGGYAQDGALLRSGPGGAPSWILDPFAFFAAALDPGLRPTPDVTTRNGRRMFLATINGEGWSAPAPTERLGDAPQLAGAVVIDAFLAPYPDLPVTLSLATGELDLALGGPRGEQGAQIARSALALPNVDPASLGRTLPLDWSFFENYSRDAELAALDRAARESRLGERSLVSEAVSTLGRAFAGPDAAQLLGSAAPRRYSREPWSIEAEIDGSLATLASLAPPEDPRPAMAWSGDGEPFEEALRRARAAGAPAIGGGGGAFDPTAPSIAALGPIGISVGAERQIYAPLSDDGAYTNFWSAPAYGYRRFAKTVEATETPRRLKPVHLSVTVTSALTVGLRTPVLAALEAARTAPYAPVRMADYVAAAQGFGALRIVALGEARWRIENRGGLDTLRFETAEGREPDPARSDGVLGWRRELSALYVALDPEVAAPVVALRPTDAGPSPADASAFLLEEARWRVSGLERTTCAARFVAAGFGPGDMTWRAPDAGSYRVEAFAPGATEPVFWQDVVAGPDRLLRATLPATALPELRVTISRC